MNYSELIDQVNREVKHVEKEYIRDVIMATIRVMIEELAINPAEAKIMVSGFGTLHLTYYKNAKNTMFKTMGRGEDTTGNWTIRFKPSKKLKDVVNGKIKLEDMTIGDRYLFPEYHMADETHMYNDKGDIVSTVRKKEIKHTNEYWLKQIEKIKAGKLEVKKDGTIGKVERRGRPRNKLTQEQIRHKAMYELRRDYRRARRQREKAEKEQQELLTKEQIKFEKENSDEE